MRILLSLASALYLAGALLTSQAARAVVCDNGAEVKDAAYCSYFLKYDKEGNADEKVDRRIASRLKIDNPEETRSIALIIAIGNYDKDAFDIPAAGVDGKLLTDFAMKDQKFNEVIFLKDADASAKTINYFLTEYLPNRGAEYPKKGRLLIAYSGHGVRKTPGVAPHFVLAHADGPNDADNIYSMNALNEALAALSGQYFHVLALINACFGGNVFATGGVASSPNDTETPGAYALTAGPDDKETYAVGKDHGSVFFETLINGITHGEADPQFNRLIERNGQLRQYGGLTRLGALQVYLDTEIDDVNSRHIKTETGDVLVMGHSWLGPTRPESGGGAFFFTSPIQLGTGFTEVVYVPPGEASSVPGHPEIKVFNAPDDYSIRGIDVSRHEDFIDWKVVKAKADPRFAYIRAAGPGGEDPAFKGHWKATGELGIDHGAYLVFDFCVDPAEQARRLSAIVPVDSAALPVAVDFEDVRPGTSQGLCRQTKGESQVRNQVLDLLARVRESYKKTPIIYGVRSQLNELLTEQFNPYMVWLALYRKQGPAGGDDLGLKGANPWTIWQYTSGLTVPGIGDNVDGNVFFGNEAAYQQFKGGGGNISLLVATGTVDK